MRVLIVSHGHPAFSIGGAEVASHNLMRGLNAAEGVEAHYLACASSGIARHADTPLSSLRQGDREVFLHNAGWDPFWLSNAAGLADLENEFTRYLKCIRPDVVHFHHVIGIGLEAIVQVRRALPDATVVVTFHEYLAICFNHGQMVKTKRHALCNQASPAECASCFPEHSPAHFFQREAFIKAHLKLADAYVSPSQFLIDRFVAWGLEANRFSLIENGLAPQPIAASRPLPASGRRARFGYFGQLSEFKGLLVLLDAVARIEDDLWGSDAALCIFGAGLEHQSPEFREKFAAAMTKAGNRARLYGAYQSRELPRLMGQVDWVIMPSVWWENSPVVIQEAFLHGRPPIVGDVGGMAEKVIHDETGLHFRVGSPEDLADQLRHALTDPELWQRLRANAAQPLDLAEFGRRHLRVYADALAGRRRGKTSPERAPAESAEDADGHETGVLRSFGLKARALTQEPNRARRKRPEEIVA